MIVEHLLWSQLNQIIHSTYIWPPVLIKVTRYSSLAKLAPDYRMCLQDAILSQIFIQTWDFLVSVFRLGWEGLLFLQGFSLPPLLSFPPKENESHVFFSFDLLQLEYNSINFVLSAHTSVANTRLQTCRKLWKAFVRAWVTAPEQTLY